MTIEIRRAGRRALLAACLAGALAGGASHLALAADYHEAPILADQVKAGKLPPVAERLPEHPRVITPVEQPGEYGGTWRSGMVGGSDRNWLFRMAGYEPLIAWDRDWTGTLVLDLVAWARGQEGRPLPYSLLGHSAGGQFLDRLAAFVPTEARRIVVANAGSYVFPSLEIDAPYGLGKVYSGTEGEAALRRYLEQPLTIYLGQGDTRDDERNDYPEALAQGASRYQRGLNVFNAAKTLAQARGWKFNWRLVELPGVGHNARKMFSAPQASEALSP